MKGQMPYKKKMDKFGITFDDINSKDTNIYYWICTFQNSVLLFCTIQHVVNYPSLQIQNQLLFPSNSLSPIITSPLFHPY